MKIAFFVTEFPTLSETFIANQIIALQNSGHLVHIFSRKKPAPGPVHQAIIDARLSEVTWYLDDVPASRPGKILNLIKKSLSRPASKNNRALYKSAYSNATSLSLYDFIPFLDKHHYDVLHAHFGLNGTYVTEIRKLGLYKNARFITTFHGYDLDENLASQGFYTDLFTYCDTFTINSLYSKRILVQLGCPENKISLLPVGLDIRKFDPGTRTPAADEVLRILFVGRLYEFKAPDKVIEICRVLKNNGRIKFQATIVGEGSMFPLITGMIEQYGLADVIQIVGGKTQEEIIALMKASDVFLYPGITYNNRAENQGLVLQEAQAMQLPVVVSDAGGIPEGVIDGKTGFILPENDLDGFVEKIELLTRDIELRIKMGEAGRKFVEEKYNSVVLNDALLRIYQN